WIRKRFPDVGHKVELLLNGVPEELCRPVRTPKGQVRRSLKVVGYSEAQESVSLALAVAALRKSQPDMNLRFIGNLPSVKPSIEEILGPGVVFTGPVAHDCAINEIATAGVLIA